MRVIQPSKRTEVWYREQLEILVKQLKEEALSAFKVTNDSMSDAQRKLSIATERMMNIPVFGFAKRVSEMFVRRINKTQYQRMSDEYKTRFGIDIAPTVDEDLLQEMIEANVNLITSIKTDFISQVGDEVRKQLFEGERSTGLIQIIHERGNVTMNRAKFIARDQTAKLNSAITRERNDKLGIKTYIWTGARDVRQRKDHKVMNGRLCRFDDATVYSDDNGETWKKRSAIGGVQLHPGEDYNCRCGMAPRLDWD